MLTPDLRNIWNVAWLAFAMQLRLLHLPVLLVARAASIMPDCSFFLTNLCSVTS